MKFRKPAGDPGRRLGSAHRIVHLCGQKVPSELAPNAKGYRIVRVEKSSGEILQVRARHSRPHQEPRDPLWIQGISGHPPLGGLRRLDEVPNIVGTVLLVLGGGCVAYVAGIGLYLLITGKTLMGAFLLRGRDSRPEPHP
ncbi:MAG: hypothetical protein MZV70_70515 [Desulfobacterales bacterium]|nr:hypothetical protein [Desulfobacterales bacterium]